MHEKLKNNIPNNELKFSAITKSEPNLKSCKLIHPYILKTM